RLCHNIGDQPLVTAVFPNSRDGVDDEGMLPQCRFNLSHLHAKPAHLYLVVSSPQKLDLAVQAVAANVSGFVKPLPFALAERIGHEFFSSRFGVIDVTTRKPRPADINLAGCTDRPRL